MRWSCNALSSIYHDDADPDAGDWAYADGSYDRDPVPDVYPCQHCDHHCEHHCVPYCVQHCMKHCIAVCDLNLVVCCSAMLYLTLALVVLFQMPGRC